jgi:hypothetical protein
LAFLPLLVRTCTNAWRPVEKQHQACGWHNTLYPGDICCLWGFLPGRAENSKHWTSWSHNIPQPCPFYRWWTDGSEGTKLCRQSTWNSQFPTTSADSLLCLFFLV